jgi:hypothetical protein
LRRIHPETRDHGQPLDRILMLAEQTSHFLVQLSDLLIDQSQALPGGPTQLKLKEFASQSGTTLD